jgi:hypothetical protein
MSLSIPSVPKTISLSVEKNDSSDNFLRVPSPGELLAMQPGTTSVSLVSSSRLSPLAEPSQNPGNSDSLAIIAGQERFQRQGEQIAQVNRQGDRENPGVPETPNGRVLDGSSFFRQNNLPTPAEIDGHLTRHGYLGGALANPASLSEQDIANMRNSVNASTLEVRKDIQSLQAFGAMLQAGVISEQEHQVLIREKRLEINAKLLELGKLNETVQRENQKLNNSELGVLKQQLDLAIRQRVAEYTGVIQGARTQAQTVGINTNTLETNLSNELQGVRIGAYNTLMSGAGKFSGVRDNQGPAYENGRLLSPDLIISGNTGSSVSVSSRDFYNQVFPIGQVWAQQNPAGLVAGRESGQQLNPEQVRTQMGAVLSRLEGSISQLENNPILQGRLREVGLQPSDAIHAIQNSRQYQQNQVQLLTRDGLNLAIPREIDVNATLIQTRSEVIKNTQLSPEQRTFLQGLSDVQYTNLAYHSTMAAVKAGLPLVAGLAGLGVAGPPGAIAAAAVTLAVIKVVDGTLNLPGNSSVPNAIGGLARLDGIALVLADNNLAREAQATTQRTVENQRNAYAMSQRTSQQARLDLAQGRTSVNQAATLLGINADALQTRDQKYQTSLAILDVTQNSLVGTQQIARINQDRAQADQTLARLQNSYAALRGENDLVKDRTRRLCDAVNTINGDFYKLSITNGLNADNGARIYRTELGVVFGPTQLVRAQQQLASDPRTSSDGPRLPPNAPGGQTSSELPLNDPRVIARAARNANEQVFAFDPSLREVVNQPSGYYARSLLNAEPGALRRLVSESTFGSDSRVQTVPQLNLDAAVAVFDPAAARAKALEPRRNPEPTTIPPAQVRPTPQPGNVDGYF